MEKISSFFKSNWSHFAIIGVFLLLTFSYFNLQFEGYGLKQHDIEQHKAMSKEIADHREITGEESLWTNSMFGGMPSMQISLKYEGNYFKKIQDFFIQSFPPPAGIVLLYMIGFYIFCLCIGLNPWIGLFGSVAFAFSSYDIIIIQAGHNSKAMAVAYMAPVIGAFYMAYKRNLKWGVLLSAIFMTFELTQNHLQVSYYMFFLLLGIGVVFLIDALMKKEIKHFAMASAGIVVAYLLAVAINYGNITLTNDYAKHTIRGGNDLTSNADGSTNKNTATSGLDKDYVTQWSYGIGESFTLLSPYVKGGGTVALSDSPFAEDAMNSDLTSSQINGAMRYPVYWGEQPMTSGPVYIGVIVVFLAFVGLFFIQSKIKWALLAVTILTLALSWGKNYMGLTDFFLDNVPGYNKFRAVTIILVIVEICLPILAVLFLNELVKNRDKIKEQKKKFIYVCSSFILFLLIIKMVGLGDNYTSTSEINQQESIGENIKNQLSGMDPSVLQSQYNLDINDSAQLEEFINQQKKPYQEGFEAMKTIRESIFNSSMNRSILFSLLAFGVLMLIYFTQLSSIVIVIALTVLTAFDIIPVAKNYLGNQEIGSNTYKYWDLASKTLYPINATEADYQILELETTFNPTLKENVRQAEQLGAKKANELGFTGNDRNRVIDAYKFSALNKVTNYRVFDMSGGFSSAQASYFHKSLGGYHGAKLRNIQNLYEFHLTKSNNKVYDMLNVKYFIQSTEKGKMASPNMNALGNVWFIKTIETKKTPDDEIRALGNQFDLKNIGVGSLVVNQTETKNASVFGSEKINYVLQKDTLTVSLPNGLGEGMEALFVMDINGKTNLVPKTTIELDTANSFLILVEIKVSNEFKPKTEGIMLESEAKGLNNIVFSSEGKIEMKSYAPNKITYQTDSKDNQFAVFSEIYYPEGWTAKIDGKEVAIRKVNYLLRGLEIPKGKHEIEFSFMLPKYKKSVTYARFGSGLLIILLIAFVYLDFIKKRKENSL
jgi:hypothetical protein